MKNLWPVVCVLGMSAVATAAEDVHSQAEALVRSGRMQQAEKAYREALAGSPHDYRLQLGLARVLLWSGKYAAADRAFRDLLRAKPRDAAALLGLAQAAYWSGDFRSARKRFLQVIAVDANNADARKALDELKGVALPLWEVTATAADDSQPLRRAGATAGVSLFSDPLTRWDLTLRRTDFENHISSDVTGIGAGVRTSFPRFRLSVDASAEHFRFPDGERGTLGVVSIGRRILTASTLYVAAERVPLLGTTSALQNHTIATRYRVTWKTVDTARWLAAVSAHAVRYSDDNRGEGADAYAIAPVLMGRVEIRAGLSAAWRDTDENRFTFTGFRSERIRADSFSYTFTGVYDPYWTPHRLRDGRAVVVLSSAAGKVKLKLQADGGFARDRYLAFTPPSGPTPSPLFTLPLMLDRSFRPWRASLEGVVPLLNGAELRARYHHEVTAFYRANEIEASVGGHF